MKPGSWFAVGACALVVVGLTWAFLTIGTPMHNRDVGFDEKRTAGMDALAASVREHYRSRRLPVKLATDYESNATTMTLYYDPQTGRRYEYSRVDEGRFRLCARFSAASDPAAGGRPTAYEPDWPHPAGFFCKKYSLEAE